MSDEPMTLKQAQRLVSRWGSTPDHKMPTKWALLIQLRDALKRIEDHRCPQPRSCDYCGRPSDRYDGLA